MFNFPRQTFRYSALGVEAEENIRITELFCNLRHISHSETTLWLWIFTPLLHCDYFFTLSWSFYCKPLGQYVTYTE